MVAEANRAAEQSSMETTMDDIDALVDAARYNDMDDIISLSSAGVSLDSKDSEGRTALHMAAANGHLSIVEFLINKGVEMNALNAEKNAPLHWACLNGHIEVVKKLILAGANMTLLNRVDGGWLTEVENIFEDTPLMGGTVKCCSSSAVRKRISTVRRTIRIVDFSMVPEILLVN